MKRLFQFAVIVCMSTIRVQAQQALPDSLTGLMTSLPVLARQPSFDFGHFADAFDVALGKSPALAPAAVAICSRDLTDPDERVRYDTLSILYDLAFTLRDPSLLVPVEPQIVDALNGSSEKVRGVGILLVNEFQGSASNSMLEALNGIMRNSTHTVHMRVSAAESLSHARPQDKIFQQSIAAMINDDSQPVTFRTDLLYATAIPGAGSILSDNVTRIVTAASDKGLRDAAISASTRIGLLSLSTIQDKLVAIQNDPSESLSSHRVTSKALRVLQSSRKPLAN